MSNVTCLPCSPLRGTLQVIPILSHPCILRLYMFSFQLGRYNYELLYNLLTAVIFGLRLDQGRVLANAWQTYDPLGIPVDCAHFFIFYFRLSFCDPGVSIHSLLDSSLKGYEPKLSPYPLPTYRYKKIHENDVFQHPFAPYDVHSLVHHGREISRKNAARFPTVRYGVPT